MSCTGGCLEGENVLFEEVLAGKFFQVASEALAVDGSMFLTVVIRTIYFCSRVCRIILDRPRAPHPRLVFDDIEDFVMRSLSGH